MTEKWLSIQQTNFLPSYLYKVNIYQFKYLEANAGESQEMEGIASLVSFTFKTLTEDIAWE